MSTELNELLPASQDERAQIWIIGSHDQVAHLMVHLMVHLMHECYVHRLASDRVQFTPTIPAPFATGKYMTVLVW